MSPELTPAAEFERASNQHLRPLADRLTLQFMRYDDHFVAMFAPDISVHVYFFEPFSTPGYDVVVAIAPQHESRWNPPGERGLGWFTKYLGLAGMPEDRLASAANIRARVQELSSLTDRVLERVLSAGPEFWPAFYAYVQSEIAKLPEPSWMKDYKRYEKT